MIGHMIDSILGCILLWIGSDQDIKYRYIILVIGGWLASSVLYLYGND